MRIEVTEEKPANLDAYSQIPMSLEVREIFEMPPDQGPDDFRMSRRTMMSPYLKDYDAIETPWQWSKSFDLSNWGFIAAHSNGLRIGGAAIAFDTPGLTTLEDRRDIAVLWDIRVLPEMRGKGVGSAMFKAAEAWSVVKCCRQLKVETQNINVPACLFYAKQGCVLQAIHRDAYREFPNEIQMLWYKELT